MLKLEFTGRFKKDYKIAVKRGCNPKRLEEVLELLQKEEILPSKYRDHQLVNSRNYQNMRECHIEPDWLLVYQVIDDELILRLIRTGSHSDLFLFLVSGKPGLFVTKIQRICTEVKSH